MQRFPGQAIYVSTWKLNGGVDEDLRSQRRKERLRSVGQVWGYGGYEGEDERAGEDEREDTELGRKQRHQDQGADIFSFATSTIGIGSYSGLSMDSGLVDSSFRFFRHHPRLAFLTVPVLVPQHHSQAKPLFPTPWPQDCTKYFKVLKKEVPSTS
ncbi:hypothetical protein HYFRA_00003839 [Hymenoscyphus fraxineus]|uniref:Uncharacterized protein n=1 Tax=Hymenoscyphus fraxineus TaxID=746836 RepID=A0A9N9KZQ5_9HELO|nr:hypothetical protein HYFRA_00003839 [Hymenoscyphus fraxineus]